MRFRITAASNTGREQWIEDFTSKERALDVLAKRGWKVEHVDEIKAEDEQKVAEEIAQAQERRKVEKVFELVEQARETGDWSSVTADDVEAAGGHIVLTTCFTVANRDIDREIQIVTAECVYGVNLIRDLMADVRDTFGGRSKALQKVLKDARRTVLTELRREALMLRADAVVGVALNYQDLEGGKLVMLAASGTAVKLAPDDTVNT